MAASNQEKWGLEETWMLNHRVTLRLIEQLSAEQLAYAPSPAARNIGEQLAHLHRVRIMWLEVASPASAKTLPKIERGEATKIALVKALTASAEAILGMLREGQATGKMKAYARGPIVFFSYLLAHESHHRGQILLHLKAAGMPLDKTASFGLWEWDKI